MYEIKLDVLPLSTNDIQLSCELITVLYLREEEKPFQREQQIFQGHHGGVPGHQEEVKVRPRGIIDQHIHIQKFGYCHKENCNELHL